MSDAPKQGARTRKDVAPASPVAVATAMALNDVPGAYAYRVWAHGTMQVDGSVFAAGEPLPFTRDELLALGGGKMPSCVEKI